jgi:uncharacterized membrane protein YhaH (DUF805 family)
MGAGAGDASGVRSRTPPHGGNGTVSWYLEAWKNIISFGGRARRKEFWYFFLFHFLFIILVGIVDQSLFKGAPLLSLPYFLAGMVAGLSVSIRRLHDIGNSGWWILIQFFPVIGGLWLFVLHCLDSEPGSNDYGPNPKM